MSAQSCCRSGSARSKAAPVCGTGQHAAGSRQRNRIRQQHCRANTSDSAPADTDASEEGLRVNDQTGVSGLSFAKSVVQVTGLQLACGFVVSPVLANLLEDAGLPPVFGPLLAQLTLIAGAGYVIDRCLKEGNNSEDVFFRYIAKPLLLIEAVAAASIALAVALFLNKQGGSYPSTTSIDVHTLLDADIPSTMAATGLTTVAITPWIEERIFRGFILQGAIPFLGTPGAVVASSVLYAGSHLSVAGFPQLLALGLLLGGLHVYAQRNLLLPTFTHSLFNTAILVAILLSLPTQSMQPTIPESVVDAAEQAANVVAPAITDAVTKD